MTVPLGPTAREGQGGQDGRDGCVRCGARLPPGRAGGACPRCLWGVGEPPALVGGKFELLEELGAGGMGTVYRARDTRLGRSVALKLLADELGADPAFRERFAREARTLALLNHPAIVTAYDFGEDEGQLYIAMELVEGRPLAAEAALPAERAREIGERLCEALAYAHARGIIHRDIKPANILVGADGAVKLADFGVARLVPAAGAASAGLTGSRAVLGTPHFIAPEAMAGAPPDPRMDLYSVGVLLHQLLTGRLPLGAFEPPPGPLGTVVMRALAADPDRRYPSAEAMRAALAAARAPGAGAPVPVALVAHEGLAPDERNWQRATAILLSVCTAVGLWAMLECVRPRVLSAEDAHPLVMFGTRTLPGGRLYSPARFETGPILAALAGLAPALFAYGLLRRHWRRAGLDHPAPDRPVREARWLLGVGLVAGGLYLLQRALIAAEVPAVGVYMPILGGLLEVLSLYFLWFCLLECQRRGRSLVREPLIPLGFLLAILPPAIELYRYLRAGG
jgi:serine/threonine-protein kinase